MPNKNHHPDTLIQYLLGQLSEAERAGIEEKYFDDAEYYEQLKIVEAELLDDYVNHRLSAPQREAFEKSFLNSPNRRRRIAFAEVWREYIEKEPPLKEEKSSSPFFNWLKRPLIFVPLTVVLLLALCGVWLARQERTLTTEIEAAVAKEQEKIERETQQRLQEERQRQEQMAREQQVPEQLAPTPENRPPPSLIASIVLSAGTVRSSGTLNRVEVNSSTETIELILPFKDEGHTSYSAVIERASGTQVLNKANLPAQTRGAQKRAVWSIAAKTLPAGDYLLTLRGITESGESEDLAEYQFRVLQK